MLDRFTEVGLIDDAAFARAWVSSRQAGRGLARRALSAELRAKGVDRGGGGRRPSRRSTTTTSGRPRAGWSSARCPACAGWTGPPRPAG